MPNISFAGAKKRKVHHSSRTFRPAHKEPGITMLGVVESGLLRLVDELILNIIDHIDARDALCSLAATCTRFQGLVEPYIWRDILVVKGEHARRIATALNSRDERTDYVKDLAIRYQDGQRDGISELNHFMGLMGKLRHLHIESPCPNNSEWQAGPVYFDGCSRIDYQNLIASAVYPPLGMQLTLPMLQSLTLHAHGSGHQKFALGRAVAMFRHATLRNITLSCLNFDAGSNEELGISDEEAKSTALRSLALIECNVDVRFLDGILRLPKALKELSIGERLHTFPGCKPSMDPDHRTSSVLFLTALERQASSLQRLTHCGGQIRYLTSRRTDPAGAAKLRSLVNLEYLELGFESHLYYYLREGGFPPGLKTLKMLDSAISINAGPNIDALSVIAYRSLSTLVTDCLPRTLAPDFHLHLKFSDHAFYRLGPLAMAPNQAQSINKLFFDRSATYKIASVLRSYSPNSHFFVSRETFPDGNSFIPPYMYGEQLPVDEIMYDSHDFWRFNGVSYRVMDDEELRNEMQEQMTLRPCKTCRRKGFGLDRCRSLGDGSPCEPCQYGSVVSCEWDDAEDEVSLYNLRIDDAQDSGDKDVFTFTGQKSQLKKSYVLVFDSSNQQATLEPLSSSYTFNLATRNGKDVSSQHAKIYPKKLKDDAHTKDDDDNLFGEAAAADDEGGEADPDNPYDFRHFLSKEKEKRGDESEYKYASSPDYRTGTGSAVNTPQFGARASAASTAPVRKPVAAPAPKKRKTAVANPMVKPKKAQPTPSVRLQRTATDPAPKPKPKPKSKAAEPPASKINNGTLAPDYGIGGGRFRASSNGPISLASAVNSDSELSPMLHARNRHAEEEIDFGDLGGDDAEGEDDDEEDYHDGDIEPMDIGPPVRHETTGHDRKPSMAVDVPIPAAADNDEDDLEELMRKGLESGDSSEESEEDMHSLAFFSLAAVVGASMTPPGLSHHVEGIEVPSAQKTIPAVIVVEENRTYAVKLECAGCPFVSWKQHHEAQWQHPPPNNSLMMLFKLDESNSALLLDDHRIFPLDPMPLHIGAMQVPNDVGKDALDWQMVRDFKSDTPGRMRFPLQYEHGVFRAEEPGSIWLQFNVTGLAFGEDTEPFQLGHKVIQVLLRTEHRDEEYKLSIGDVQVVEAKDMAHAPRMPCGKLAMVKTAFNPAEWDEYGKFGTWKRTWNLVISQLGDYWSDHLEDNMMLLPLLVLLAVGMLIANRLYQSRQQDDRDADTETTLLGRCALPPYADIPVIKIEELKTESRSLERNQIGPFPDRRPKFRAAWANVHKRHLGSRFKPKSLFTPSSRPFVMSVVVEQYNTNWPQQFEKIKAELEHHLQDVDYLTIEHVGSTSVPGLAAKPFIDVDIIVTRDNVQPTMDALIANGKLDYLGELGIVDRHAFKDPSNSTRHNIYVCVDGAAQTRNHLSLRDTLRTNASLRDEYARVKLELAANSTNIVDYIVAKGAIIQKILLASHNFSKEELTAIARANVKGERFGAIKTPRLLLREFVMKDEVGYFQLEGNEQNARYQEWPPRTRQQARQLVLQNIRNHNDIPRTIYELAVENTDGQFIGRVGAKTSQANSDKLPGESTIKPVTRANLWFSFLPSVQGQGFATEAMTTFIDALKERLQDQGKLEMQIECDPRNEPSWKLAERLGFERHSLTKEKEFIKGEWVDSLSLIKVVGDVPLASKHVRRSSKVSTSMRLNTAELFETCH
ncbi:arabinogalactan endo-beta-14-galactanase [Pyrenophora seminiperda CCB06]|uniref:Arabinogalactan endo-beta-14-galactanase n=1 Tax=Pyrenophora seminiperda CCB06 TaxID=1302712 RepID=A0A3M7MJT5_9PLEO|nr:arabinogalactan endo-beta-14-galactanase [Pyrenophora seminiperda CCB06]